MKKASDREGSRESGTSMHARTARAASSNVEHIACRRAHCLAFGVWRLAFGVWRLTQRRVVGSHAHDCGNCLQAGLHVYLVSAHHMVFWQGGIRLP